jgi:hypothetical protein
MSDFDVRAIAEELLSKSYEAWRTANLGEVERRVRDAYDAGRYAAATHPQALVLLKRLVDAARTAEGSKMIKDYTRFWECLAAAEEFLNEPDETPEKMTPPAGGAE